MQKILIVDDSELNREILAAMLETEYKIDMAKDGAEAVTILEKNWENYQIVLLDLNMPVLNGYEVLKIMKEKQWLDSLPVICISAETSEESIGRAYELGAADYFTRPFDTAVVLRRVHNTIALYTKASTGLHDAMEMLSNIFYRIMKINLTKDTSVEEYLEQNRYQVKRIAVELNGDILPKYSYSDTMLKDGDRLEVVTFVGGG